ncbi:hypothetical protein Bca101_026613 [Brassica carinata]
MNQPEPANLTEESLSVAYHTYSVEAFVTFNLDQLLYCLVGCDPLCCFALISYHL